MLKCFDPMRRISSSHDVLFLTLDRVASDLDQLTEIMKITGTPTQDFISKLQSQDVRYIHYFILSFYVGSAEREYYSSLQYLQRKP